MGWGLLERFGTGRVTLGEVRDGSGDPRGGLGRFWSTLGRFGTGRGTLGVIQDGSLDSQIFPNMSGDPRGGSGRVE